ncbi:MAG: OB-fold nucleic acid binding domain-containing protein, partial [Spirochaetota bacterium]
KSHYRPEYMAALLSASKDSQDDITKYIADCRMAGIRILPPDINRSRYSFTIEDGKIRFGFSAVKGLGDRAIECIIQAREKTGSFTTVQNMIENIDIGVINKGALESLIKCGALDSLHENRASLLAGIDIMIETAKFLQKDKKTGQGNLFGGDDADAGDEEILNLPVIPEWPDNMKLGYEKEMLGLYISGHPLARYEAEIREYSSCSIVNLDDALENGSTFSIVGILENQRKHITKAGKEMAFALLEDMEGSLEVVFFPRTYAKYESLIFCKEPVMLTGEVKVDEEDSSENKSKKMLVNEVRTLTEARHGSISALHINIDTVGTDETLLDTIRRTLEHDQGKCPVFFHVSSSDGKEHIVQAHSCFNIDPTEELIGNLRGILGNDSIRYTFRNGVCH